MIKRALAIFDFDGTMIAGDSIVDLVHFMRERSIVSVLSLLWMSLVGALGRAGILDMKFVKTQALKPLRRLSRHQAEIFCRTFAQERLIPRVFPASIQAIESHKARGDLLVLASASPDCYLRFIGPALGFDSVLATVTDERFRVLRNVKGEEKPKQVENLLKSLHLNADWAASTAYGDSASDLPMLNKTGHPYLVNAKKTASRQAPSLPRISWKSGMAGNSIG